MPKLSAPAPIALSPIRLEVETLQTSIRTDRSGSQARAEEDAAKGRILLPANVSFSHGDMLIIMGIEWRIMSSYPRMDMDGQINHYQVDLMLWG